MGGGNPGKQAGSPAVSVPGLKGYHFVVIFKECLDAVSEIVTLFLQNGEPVTQQEISCRLSALLGPASTRGNSSTASTEIIAQAMPMATAEFQHPRERLQTSKQVKHYSP